MQLLLVLFKLLLVADYIAADAYGSQIAVNNHLLVWYTSSDTDTSLIRYQCIGQTNISSSIEVNFMHIYSISIGKQQNESQLYFVVAGLMSTNLYMSKLSVNCDNNQMNTDTVSFNESDYYMLRDSFIFTVDPYGRFVIGYTRYFTLVYDLISLKHWYTNITWSSSEIFFPTAVDIFTPFIYVAGSFVSNGYGHSIYLKASLYLMKINFNNSKYDVSFVDVWTSDDIPTDSLMDTFISVSANHYNDARSILIGIPYANTIHLFSVNYTAPIRFQYISSKTQFHSNDPVDYGTEFAWLNHGKILAVLSVASEVKRYPILYYYDILESEKITDDTVELSIFPNKEQVYPENFNKNDLYIASSLSILSTLYGSNSAGQLLIIPPSSPGYYSITYRSLEYVNVKEQIFSFIPNSAQCPPGTYKNDIGVWPCSSCKRIETNSTILPYPSNTSISINCSQCINKTACPLEIVTELNWLSDIKQNGIYPESPETDVFDDVLLFHIFQTNNNFKSPFFILVIVLLIGLIITGLISLLKLSKRFVSKQQYLIKFIQHFDLIGEGKLWFGGLMSIILLFLAIFAAKFAYSYHYRYPIEKQISDDTTSGDFNSFYNAKFDTSLQLLTFSVEQHEQIFDLLNSQQFTLNIELLNTLIHCGRVTLKHEEDNDFLPFSCYTNGRILYLSTELPTQKLTLTLDLSSSYTIDAIRIGLSGSDAHLTNNYLQKLNFSKLFNRTNEYLSHNPLISLQLTKSINITESLTDNDNTTYTGLWLPSFTYDINQLFPSLNFSENKNQTILSFEISETEFFIKNKQKPIARRSEIIFHTILFIGMCIDLTVMILLILRLWFTPIIIYFLDKLFNSNSLVYRLIHAEKNSSEIQMKKMQEQIETMSKKIDTLMESVHRSYELIDEEIHGIIKEKF